MLFTTAIDIQQIHKILPALIQTLNIRGYLFCTSKFLVVGVDLILHPAQVLDGFPFARIECFDLCLALLLAKLLQALLHTAINQASIKWSFWLSAEIKSFY